MGYKIRVRAAAIIIQNNRILMNCFGDGLYYNFPGGGIEENEIARDAVAREVYEESGLAIEVENHIFTYEYVGEHGHSFSHFFKCKLIGNDEITPPIIPDVNPDNPEITSKAVWISVSDLQKTPFVPKSIYNSLMSYIKTGIFEPSFFEDHNPA